MPLKVLFITDYFGPHPGGIENYHTGLMKHWPDDIICLCFDHESVVDKETVEKFDKNFPKNIYRFPASQKYLATRATIKRSIEIIQYIQKHFSIRHILLGNISLYTKFLFRFIRNMEIPYSIILHPVDLEHLSYFQWQTRTFLKHAKYIFVYSHYFYELALIKGIPQEKLVLISMGVYPRWEEVSNHVKEELKESVNARKDKTKILTVGPLTKKKHTDRIVKILEYLKKENYLDSLHWFVVGSGSEYYYMHELIHSYGYADTVTLTGFLNDKEVGYMYYNSDIYYHPGGDVKDPFAGFSMTLLEAGYTALPSVCGSGAAVDEFVQNNLSGFVIRYDDYELLSRKILELSKDSRLRRKMGRYAEQKIQKEFYIERAVRNIYDRITGL